jgi:O-antigen/teichoic acid export membrane protein
MTETAPRKLGDITKTLVSMFWIYGTRGLGLLWATALIGHLGISDYGLYGMAVAVNSIMGPSLDNPFSVRAIRESEERFVAERTSRYLLGVALITVGLLLLPISYVAGFGIIVAGGEICLNVLKSRVARDGHPHLFWRMDTARQVTGVGIGTAYLFLAAHPSLMVASLLYCTPYVVIVLLGARVVRGHRPGLPGSPRLMAALVGELLGTALYLQGDVLLLGALTNSTTVGYYSLTWVVCAAVAALGQSFGMNFHEKLRNADGALSAGPQLRTTLLLAAAGGALVLTVGVVMLFWPTAEELAVAMMIMSIFAALRVVVSVFQVILMTQRRDIFRLTAAFALVPVKFGLVAALSFAGAVGAAISTSITDALLLTCFSLALYRPRTKSRRP